VHRILLCAIAVLLLSSCWRDDDSGDRQPARYRAAVVRVMDQYRAPGVVAGVWVPGSEPWKMAFGVADVATRRPLDLRDHFSIRSVTKSFTVTVILQLARDGALSLDDPIERHVANIPNGASITLAQLAAMESGVKNYSETPAFIADLIADPGRTFTPAGLVGYAVPLSPAFAPGAQYDYSNTNTVLLGMVIERVTKTPLAEVFRTRIFEPLKLAQTTYPSAIALPDPHPTPYAVDPRTGEVDDQPFISPTGLDAAGAMVSTLDDLGAWGEALGTGRLLTPALQAQRLAHSRIATNGPVYERYGLGIGVLKGWWGHTGSGIGFQAATFHDTRSGATIAVLVNATPESNSPREDNIAQDVFAALADVVASR
jgi:D-alanyl-D-alanine carboxypeptidase